MRQSRRHHYNPSSRLYNGKNYPVLAQGQADDLLIDTGKRRIWKSRVDGSISHEVYNESSGKWEIEE